MVVWTRRFNLNLALAAALALLCGCHTHRQKELVSTLRVHIQMPADAGDTSQTVSVLRSDPVLITIARNPILTEANITAAWVTNSPGGFAVEVKFDENGAWMLEEYSSANPGGHFAIFGQWGDLAADARWLAAPLITHRIANGVLSFTPDCSREEADRLVLGLNDVAAENRKGELK